MTKLALIDDEQLQRFCDFGKAHGLTTRESEIVAYAYLDQKARAVAHALFIAESTVYTHQKRIYRKLGVHSRRELVELVDSWR